MSILQRFSDIMRNNFNALLDKCEDSVKMVDQLLLDLRKDLADVKQETAAVIADEKKPCAGSIIAGRRSAAMKRRQKKAISKWADDNVYLSIARKQQMEAQFDSLQEV